MKKRGLVKTASSVFDYLPYTFECLVQHLENNFVEGMTWDNYGEWHIDHIVAESKFSYNSFQDPEFLKCWDLGNLQPLWKQDNLSKRDSDWKEWLCKSGKAAIYQGRD